MYNRASCFLRKIADEFVEILDRIMAHVLIQLTLLRTYI